MKDIIAMEQTASKEWEGDELDRSTEGSFLYNYLINRYHADSNDEFKSLVLNINASWGVGKTFFLSRWAEDLTKAGHPVVSFNAWNSDFQNDPLVAFITEIENQLEIYLDRSEPAKKLIKKTFRSGARLLKNSIPLLSAILLKQFTGLNMERIQEMMSDEEDIDLTALYMSDDQTPVESGMPESSKNKEITKSFVSLLSMYGKETLEKYLAQKKDIETFRTNFSNLVNYIDKRLAKNKLPIFIIIDELDRCRPNYAIELLERIKHLFNIKGVYFVLATDTEQLCHSIKAIYGNEFDSSKYLNRFFDQTYEFQDSDYETFALYLFKRYKISNFLNFYPFFGPQSMLKEKDTNIVIFATYSKFFRLTLRDQEQIMNHFYTICLSWPSKTQKIHSAFLLFLLMIKHVSNDEFERLKEFKGDFSHCKKISPDFYNGLQNSVRFKEKSKQNIYEVNIITIDTVLSLYNGLILKTNQEVSSLFRRNSSAYWEDDFRNYLLQEFNNGLNQLPDNQTDVLSLNSYFETVKQTGQLTKEKNYLGE